MAGLFITSTGTGIGKTFLTEQLLCLDQGLKRCLCGSKPIITGWPLQAQQIAETDTGRLLAAQQQPVDRDTVDQISPWRFQAPLAPSRAAKQEHKTIHPSELIAHCQKMLKAAGEHNKLHLFEGVGGVMVPIKGQWTVMDWMQALGCPVLLVVGSYLGTLSHTLSALTVLEMRNIPVLAMVLSESLFSTLSLVETLESFQELLPTTPLFLLPQEEQMRNLCLNSLYAILLQYLFSNTMAPNSATV